MSGAGERDPMVLEAAVLRLLLIAHPAELTVGDLEVRLRASSPRARRELDAAVEALLEAGLAHRRGEYVLPSRAALYFDGLPVD